MFKSLRELSEGVRSLVTVITALAGLVDAVLEAWAEDGKLRERVGALEASVTQNMAEAEALEIKAESRFKAARSSEERARGILNAAEELNSQLAPDDEDGPGEIPPEWFDLQARNGIGGEAPGVQQVHEGVGFPTTREQEKARARSLKGLG